MSAARGVIACKISGVNLNLVCDYNTLCRIEEKDPRSALEVFEACDTSEGAVPRFSDIRLLLWAMAQAEQPELDLEQIGRLIGNDVEAAMLEIGRAFDAAMPEADPQKKTGKAKAKAKKPRRERSKAT
jgi:hypothetical protein